MSSEINKEIKIGTIMQSYGEYNRFLKISKKQYDIDFKPDYAKYEDIKLPKRATIGSAGYDFYSTVNAVLNPGETIKIPTGIRIILDGNKYLACYPRSGLGFKYRLQLDNTVGIIDSDYSNSDNEGHIWIKVTNDTHDDKQLVINIGDAFAQGIINQFFIVHGDDTTEVRNGGFGSTGK